MNFDFGGSFRGFNVDYGNYYAAQATPALGGGFTPVTSYDYSDAWIQTDLHRYIGEPLMIEIRGAGGNPPQTPNSTVSTDLGVYSINDGIGGVFTAANVLLNGLADRSTAASIAYIPQITQTATWLESQMIGTVKAVPNIVGGLMTVGQMFQSAVKGDTRDVYTNAANFIGSAAGAELGLILVGAIGLPLGTAALGVGAAAAAGGIAASWGIKTLYDMAAHNLNEDQQSGAMASARTAVEQYYWTHLFEPGVRDWNLN